MSIFPKNVATFGGAWDSLTLQITVISGVVFVLAEIVLLALAWRYRRAASPRAGYVTGERWRELKWVMIPVALIVVFDFYIDVATANVWNLIKVERPETAMAVRVVAQQFSWEFVYPGEDGKFDTEDDVKSANELRVPTDTNVEFQLESRDVLHSFWVPSLRLKQDIVPGRIISGWFNVTEPGDYEIACAEICGGGHALMQATLKAEAAPLFNAWLAAKSAAPAPDTSGLPGAKLVQEKTCAGCHSVDGSKLTGPTFKGLYGREESVITDGVERLLVVDDAYIKRSVEEPTADVVKGYQPVMPPLRALLSDEELEQIVEYIRSLR